MEQELKQKQIEEMAKVYDDATSYARNYLGSLNNAGKWYGNAFYNAGYRKIPENAVVLTREEFERHKGFSREEVDEISETAIKNSRKETAEKFANLVEFHSVATIDENGIEQFTISALGLKEILHEEFGIPYDKIAKEIMEGKECQNK